MKDQQKICLSCKYFRLEQIDRGICRVDKDKGRDYPAKKTHDDCAGWQNCGQQYYIRLGWIKAKAKISEEGLAQ